MRTRHVFSLVVASVWATALTLSGVPRLARPVAPQAMPDLDAACASGAPYFAAVCYPYQTGAAESPLSAITMFSDTANDMPQYRLATHSQIGAVWGLAYSQREAALYAGAFRHRAAELGPGGIGAIYRIDMTTGAIGVFARVPNAADREPVISGSDRAATREAGRVGGRGLAPPGFLQLRRSGDLV